MAATLDAAGGRRNRRLILTIAFFGSLFFERALWIVYLSEEGYSLFEISLLQALLNIGMVVGEIPTGVLADRIGRRPLLVAGRLASVLYLGALLLPQEQWLLVGAFAIYGVGLTCISGAEEAMLYEADRAEDPERGFARLVGRYMAILTFAPTVALGLGGLLQLVSWELVFLTALAAQLVAAVLSAILSEPRHERVERPPTLREQLRELRETIRVAPAVRPLIIGSALFTGVTSTFYLAAQDLFAGEGFDPTAIGFIFAIESLLATIAATLAYRAERRLGMRGALTVSLAVGAVAFVAIGGGAVALVAAFLVLGFVDNVIDPVSHNALNDRIPDEHRSSVLSVLSALGALAMALLFPLIGAASQYVSQTALWMGTGAVLMLVSLWLLRRAAPARDVRPGAAATIEEPA
ncbi:MAG TPA: MFS transporter [Solirubrobacterales bacterium]|nr:MFS transporter [Solirubrobacterales bacterium]